MESKLSRVTESVASHRQFRNQTNRIDTCPPAKAGSHKYFFVASAFGGGHLHIPHPGLWAARLSLCVPSTQRIKNRHDDQPYQIQQRQRPSLVRWYRHVRCRRVALTVCCTGAEQIDDQCERVNQWYVQQVVEERHTTERRQRISQPST